MGNWRAIAAYKHARLRGSHAFIVIFSLFVSFWQTPGLAMAVVTTVLSVGGRPTKVLQLGARGK